MDRVRSRCSRVPGRDGQAQVSGKTVGRGSGTGRVAGLGRLRMPDIELVRGYVPGAIGRVAELHGTYYHAHWGFGLFFEAKVATRIRPGARRKILSNSGRIDLSEPVVPSRSTLVLSARSASTP